MYDMPAPRILTAEKLKELEDSKVVLREHVATGNYSDYTVTACIICVTNWSLVCQLRFVCAVYVQMKQIDLCAESLVSYIRYNVRFRIYE
jgi:hypothetical protein